MRVPAISPESSAVSVFSLSVPLFPFPPPLEEAEEDVVSELFSPLFPELSAPLLPEVFSRIFASTLS